MSTFVYVNGFVVKLSITNIALQIPNKRIYIYIVDFIIISDFIRIFLVFTRKSKLIKITCFIFIMKIIEF